MTTDSNEQENDQPGEDEYGGFVFGDDRSRSSHADPSLTFEQRLAPIVAFLVILSLLLTGSYLAATTLSDPSLSIFGSNSGIGSGTDTASSGPAGTVRANNSTTEAPTTMATTTAGDNTTGDAANSGTDRPTTSTDSSTITSRTTDSVTTIRTPTSITDASSANTGTTRTPDRSPSIGDFSTEQLAGGSGETVTVKWDVSDLDGDLETVRIRVVTNLGSNPKVVKHRTIAVNGSDASGETVLELDDVAPGEAYELRIETEDRTGNVAIVTTRETAR